MLKNSPFLYFLTLEFFKERKKHTGVALISLIIIFLLSSVLFVSSSLRYSIGQGLKGESDFVVQRVRGGERIDMPISWEDKLLDIYGVEKVTPRVYGRHFFKPKGESCLIVGVDMVEEQSNRALSKLIDGIDLKKFLSEANMLAGEGVAKYLKSHFYNKQYSFLTPKGEFEKVNIFATLPTQSNLITNDMVIVPIDLARKILDMGDDEVSDFALNVPNDDEWDNIADKISSFYFDARVITKHDIQKGYEELYNYKGGVFLVLFLITIATFALILYQRYNMVYSSERRSIGLLRALGWSIRDVLKLKFFETLMIVFISFIVGVALAYMYVFVMGAPLLKNIFLGSANIANNVTLVPVIDFAVLSSIFLLYAVPFVAAVLIPVWRIAITDPKEAMR